MKLHKQIAVNNACYKTGDKIKVKGLMVHSTGAPNTKLSRYVGPDDGILGTNPNGNHWNQNKPDGRSVCVHGFIGKDKNGEIRTYQTLPWDHLGWHCGGSANSTHIGIELCEDDQTDGAYLDAVYKEAVEVYAYLCKEFGLNETHIIDHSEGWKKGIASNHGDATSWFKKHGKSMNSFRADVKALLNGGTISQPQLPVEQPSTPDKSIDELARAVINGEYGSGDARKAALGSKYQEVQNRVNEILGGGSSQPSNQPSVDALANDVINGKYGSGDARRQALGSRYDEVQARVNEILGGGQSSGGKSVKELADEVERGWHGTGRERMRSLGNMYEAVQAEINRRYS